MTTTGTLPGLLAEVTATHADHPALVESGSTLSYAELARRVDRLAAGLAALGVRRGDAVAIWLPNRIAWVELVLALARLGAVAVGVNTRYRSRELLHVVHTARATALVVEPGFKGIDFGGMLQEAAPDLPSCLEHVITVGPATDPAVGAGRSTVAYDDLVDHDLPPVDDMSAPDLPSSAFSSSGTTGAPKLVLHSQYGIREHSAAVAETFGYRTPDCVVLGALPMCGVFGFNTVLSALAGGATTVLLPTFEPDAAVEAMREHRVTHTNLADEMLRRLVEHPDALTTLPDWRECGFGAFTATDPLALVTAGDEAGKRFFQTYGSSEVLAVVTYPAPGADAQRRALGGGVPCHPDVEIRVRDERGRLCGPGEPGEIEIKAPHVTCGYYGIDGIPDMDEDGFFHTGDLGQVVAGRDVAYLSRRGDVLRLAGFLVSPREIECFLEEQDGVAGAQVVGVDLGTDTAPVAFLTPEPGREIDVDGVLAAARHELARFKVPRMVHVLDEFPVTRGTNGTKIQRTVLRDLAREAWQKETTR